MRDILQSFLQLLKILFWLRITDEGSKLEMRIWSILLIKSDLKWYIHPSRSLFLYFNNLLSVTAGGPVSPREQSTCSQVLLSTSVDSLRLGASKFSVLKLIEFVILLVYDTWDEQCVHPILHYHFWHVWDMSFTFSKILFG